MQLVAGSVAVHSVVDPEVKATVPVAPDGKPDSERVAPVPYVTGPVAATVMDVGMRTTVRTNVWVPVPSWLVALRQML